MEKIYLTFPDGLPKRAHDVGLNISRFCAIAVENAVQKFENIAARDEPHKNSPETATASTSDKKAAL